MNRLPAARENGLEHGEVGEIVVSVLIHVRALAAWRGGLAGAAETISQRVEIRKIEINVPVAITECGHTKNLIGIEC